MQRMAVLTSGGDAPGMNAAIRAVVRVGVARGFEMFGVRHGYAGLIAGEFTRLGPRDVGGVVHLGGTMLGTTRCETLRTAEGCGQAVEQLRKMDISALVVVGGNGSQTGAWELHRRGVPVVGIASTIDNDLSGTDITIGATTATDVALEAIDRLRVTASALNRVFVVEVMGRQCGYLALAAGIAGGAEAIAIPEVDAEPDEIAAQVRRAYARGKSHAIVVVAEGARCNAQRLALHFGKHGENLGLDMRTTTLGHIQRGGTPGIFDRMLGTTLGHAAVEAAAESQFGYMVGMREGSVVRTPLTEVAGRTKPADLRLYDLARLLEQ